MKTVLTTLIIFLYSIIVLTAQIQIGADIDGLTNQDDCGQQLAINNAGNVVAVSSYHYNGIAQNAGMVRVFEWGGANWTQRGTSLFGDSIYDGFGETVDLNASGTVMAIGIPNSALYRRPNTSRSLGEVKIFDWDGISWNLKGNPIVGDTTQSAFGWGISLSDFGNRIAISSFGISSTAYNLDKVRVYDWNGTAWVQVGNTLQSEAIGDGLGFSMSFSATGSILALGAPENNGPIPFSRMGHVRVFSLTGTVWSQLGADIDGEVVGSVGGAAGFVDLNDSGNVVVIGGQNNNGNGTWAGHARVYIWNGTNWIQKGADIDGEAAGDLSGTSVSINAEGNIIAIGAPLNTGNGTDAGHVRVFRWENGAWAQKGVDIDGEGLYGKSGRAVALDSLGNTLAIGAPENGNNTGSSGHVRVFNLGNLVSLETVHIESVITSISPNPFDKQFIVSFKQPTTAQIKVRDAKGALVYSSSINDKTQHSVNLETKSGLYFVEIGEGVSREVHKVVKL